MIEKTLYGKAGKLTVAIDWFKWEGYSGKNVHELSAWIESFGDTLEEVMDSNNGSIKVKTLKGTSYVLAPNYYIIREPGGEYYSCEGNIFEETYKFL